jgi:hypothetical protein
MKRHVLGVAVFLLATGALASACGQNADPASTTGQGSSTLPSACPLVGTSYWQASLPSGAHGVQEIAGVSATANGCTLTLGTYASSGNYSGFTSGFIHRVPTTSPAPCTCPAEAYRTFDEDKLWFPDNWSVWVGDDQILLGYTQHHSQGAADYVEVESYAMRLGALSHTSQLTSNGDAYGNGSRAPGLDGQVFLTPQNQVAVIGVFVPEGDTSLIPHDYQVPGVPNVGSGNRLAAIYGNFFHAPKTEVMPDVAIESSCALTGYASTFCE